MLGKVGAGIDHGDLAIADQIGLRAEVGERRRIVREHAGNAGLKLLQFSHRALPRAACATTVRAQASSAGRISATVACRRPRLRGVCADCRISTPAAAPHGRDKLRGKAGPLRSVRASSAGKGRARRGNHRGAQSALQRRAGMPIVGADNQDGVTCRIVSQSIGAYPSSPASVAAQGEGEPVAA